LIPPPNVSRNLFQTSYFSILNSRFLHMGKRHGRLKIGFLPQAGHSANIVSSSCCSHLCHNRKCYTIRMAILQTNLCLLELCLQRFCPRSTPVWPEGIRKHLQSDYERMPNLSQIHLLSVLGAGRQLDGWLLAMEAKSRAEILPNPLLPGIGSACLSENRIRSS